MSERRRKSVGCCYALYQLSYRAIGCGPAGFRSRVFVQIKGKNEGTTFPKALQTRKKISLGSNLDFIAFFGVRVQEWSVEVVAAA